MYHQHTFTILLPAQIGRRSAAVTRYAAGPSPDPWIILAVTTETFDTSLANFVECVQCQICDRTFMLNAAVVIVTCRSGKQPFSRDHQGSSVDTFHVLCLYWQRCWLC